MNLKRSFLFLNLMNSMLAKLFISDNGVKVIVMVKANRFGQMEVFMKDFGKMIKQMVWEDLFTPMVICNQLNYIIF